MNRIPEGKLAIFWIVGAIAILFGAWVAGHVEMTLGTTQQSYIIALIVSLLLILFGGLCWIAISVRIAEEEEIAIAEHER